MAAFDSGLLCVSRDTVCCGFFAPGGSFERAQPREKEAPKPANHGMDSQIPAPTTACDQPPPAPNKKNPATPAAPAADQGRASGRCGTITMFIGPMFARKTSSMLDAVRRYAYAGRDCILVKYEDDTRYEEGDIVTTHSDTRQKNDARAENKGAIRVVSARGLESVAAGVKSEDKAIGIDEGQFFPDLVEWCTE